MVFSSLYETRMSRRDERILDRMDDISESEILPTLTHPSSKIVKIFRLPKVLFFWKRKKVSCRHAWLLILMHGYRSLYSFLEESLA